MPRSLLRLLILAACLPLLAACQRGLTPQQDADLRAVYGRMAANDLAGIEGRFDPQFKRPTLHQGLQFMQGMIPPQPPKVQVLKSAVQANPGMRPLFHSGQGTVFQPAPASVSRLTKSH